MTLQVAGASQTLKKTYHCRNQKDRVWYLLTFQRRDRSRDDMFFQRSLRTNVALDCRQQAANAGYLRLFAVHTQADRVVIGYCCRFEPLWSGYGRTV